MFAEAVQVVLIESFTKFGERNTERGDIWVLIF